MDSSPLKEISVSIRSPVPFWFINGPIAKSDVARELAMMCDKGIEEVIVHPRLGLEVGYLSDAWFEIFGWCVDEARKRGMRVWIYDEFNWPSGTAGMSVMRLNPDFRSKFLAVETTPLHEIDFEAFEPGLRMVAANVEAGVVTKTREVETLEALKSLTGPWLIFNCTLKHDPYYIDTLSFGAVNCFKRLTYEEYFKRFGDEFGKTIRAVFTDEPSIYWVSVGYDDWNLPYTNDYFETFEAAYGYSPVPMIPYLFFPGRNGTGFRADYWEHAGNLFNERYHANLGAWCREHGLIYTGHNNHEEPLRYQIRYQGDMFGTMRAMDIPGVDHLGKQTLGNNWISIIGHKICSSEVHSSGKPRAMSESFGVMDWDTTYTHLKRVVDWQYAQGINLLIPHALYHTISGPMKRESPPSFFYQSPHWEDFDYFVDYVHRLEEMLVGGRHVCRVAVFYPTSGLWASYQSDRKTDEFAHTDNFLNSLCLELVRNQIDFDLLDSQAFSEAAVDGGTARLGEEAYEYLIVASTPYIRPNEAARLREIAASGVKTTLFHRAIEPVSENMPDALAGASFVRTEELAGFVDRLKQELDDDIQIAGGGADDIMAYRREKDGRKITFLLNRSDKHRKVTATIKGYPDTAIFDQETGRFTRLGGRRAGHKLQAQLRFEPNQSCFIVSDVPDAEAPIHTSGEPVLIELRNLTAEIPFNVASIYHFAFTPASAAEAHEADIRTDPRYMPVNWDPNPPDFTTFAGTYEAEIEIECDPASIRMILDRDFADCELYVNDTRVEIRNPKSEIRNRETPHFLTDSLDVEADVTGLLKQASNRIRVVSPTKLSEPLRFVGDFRVVVNGTKITLAEPREPDPFNLEMDYPFYSGTMTYRAEFEPGRKCASLTLNLHDVRDAAAVTLNGQPAGKRLWPPYVFEIAKLAKPGTNALVIQVRNNMTNVILGNPRPLGLRSMPSLAASSP